MKKFLILCMALITTLVCSACSDKDANSTASNNVKNESSLTDAVDSSDNSSDNKKNDDKSSIADKAESNDNASNGKVQNAFSAAIDKVKTEKHRYEQENIDITDIIGDSENPNSEEYESEETTEASEEETPSAEYIGDAEKPLGQNELPFVTLE